jgi:hypothetical protein
MAIITLVMCVVNVDRLRSDDLLPPRSLSELPDAVRIAELIEQLDHPRFQLRSEAESQLATLGAPVIAAILDEREKLGPEGTIRSVRILEQFLVSDDLTLSDSADEALQDFQESGGTAGEHASLALDRHGLLREERAIARLRAMGGDVTPREDPFMQGIVTDLLPDDFAAQEVFRSDTIWLYPEWSGGVEGLDLLKRFSHQQGLTIYQIRGNELTLFDVQPILADLPGAQLIERGPACLGIKCAAFEPCVIQEPAAGGAAAKAGLRQGDQIEAIDSVPVRSFNQLIDELSLYDPGDIVTLTVRRGFERQGQEVEVTLSHWREINEAAYSENERPAPERQER